MKKTINFLLIIALIGAIGAGVYYFIISRKDRKEREKRRKEMAALKIPGPTADSLADYYESITDDDDDVDDTSDYEDDDSIQDYAETPASLIRQNYGAEESSFNPVNTSNIVLPSAQEVARAITRASFYRSIPF